MFKGDKTMKIISFDPSKDSSGIVILEEKQVVFSGSKDLVIKKSDPNRFIHAFNALVSYIEANFSNEEFDLVLAEDIFMGANVDTFRLLSVLNLAIDYCVDKKILKTKEYLKISNKVWKSWLFKGDNYKGLGDKDRIVKNVEERGYSFIKDKGFQDRYDALGMILGYLNRDTEQKKEFSKQKSKVKVEDIHFEYFLFLEELLQRMSDLNIDLDSASVISSGRLSKKLLLSLMDEFPEEVFYTNKKVSLGFLAEEANLPTIQGGGYCAFWLKDKSKC